MIGTRGLGQAEDHRIVCMQIQVEWKDPVQIRPCLLAVSDVAEWVA